MPWHLVHRDQEQQEKEEGDGENLSPLLFLGTSQAKGPRGVAWAVLGLLGQLNCGGRMTTWRQQGQDELPKTHWTEGWAEGHGSVCHW